MKRFVLGVLNSISKLDFLLVLSVGLIGHGVHELYGSGWSSLVVGFLLLLLAMLMARGGAE